MNDRPTTGRRGRRKKKKKKEGKTLLDSVKFVESLEEGWKVRLVDSKAGFEMWYFEDCFRGNARAGR